MLSALRKLEQWLLPEALIEARRRVQYALRHDRAEYTRWRAEKQLVAGLRRRHRFLNPPAQSDRFCLREGITFRMHNREARESYEHFCHVSPDMVEEMDGFLRETADRVALLDVGALHGVFSMAFTARAGARAVAVEPSDTAFAILRGMVALNSRENVITLVNKPVGESVRELRMRREWHHLVVETNAGQAENLNVLSCSTIDSLMREIEFAPDTLKIDVEGYEFNVLLGARETLAAHRPILFLEIHPGLLKSHGQTPAMLAASLAEQGYRFFGARGNRLAPADVGNLSEITRILCRHHGAA